MDIEELSKSQIVLLTLLVSFVTSIATGIVTVSLVEQAPPALTQTVNRVIERTVERVVPEGQAASVVTTERTVVVQESDLIVAAVQKASPSVVRIYAGDSDSFLGLGIIIDAEGGIIADVAMFGGASEVAIFLADGTRARATILSRDDSTGIAKLQASETADDGSALAFTPATISNDISALGETIVVLSGRTIPRIADGIITALVPHGEGERAIVDTNVSPDLIMQGSPLVDTQGNLMGVSTQASRASSQRAFMPVSFLTGSQGGESGETSE